MNVCVPTLTSRAGLQHRTCSQLAGNTDRGRATAFLMQRTAKQTGPAENTATAAADTLTQINGF